MKIPAVLLLLAAGLDAVSAVEKYFEIGGKMSLEPESVPKEGITDIVWKHEGSFVAEWTGDNLEYFRDFKGRTDLDKISGKLTIRNMKKTDEGDYKVEVNLKVQSVVYFAKGIRSLREQKVEALFKPLTCSRKSPRCSLSCETDLTDVGPVQYFWKQGEESWKESQKDKNITNNEDTQLIKTFSCKIKNPVSEKESEALENIFSKKSEEPSNGGLVVGIVFLVFLIVGGAALAVFTYKYPQRVAPCIPCIAGYPNEQPPGPGEMHEREGLTAGSDPGNSNGTPTVTPAEDPTVTPAEDPTVTPAEDPTVTPAKDPTVTPAENPTVSPATNSIL